ncbi:hypothetical protein EYZ11_000155 [Aspergillus tanneri]|uniref:Uncharacterized protein n=1 Tax=Aspergillus tanneri TaxID=1220188 RepID=A0A4S3JY70_9EURO|nr:hypothetical protein EYZ11_000155 [Aspergillus tanneri]
MNKSRADGRFFRPGACTFEAIVPRNNAHYEEGKFVRMLYGTPYSLQIRHEGHIYGIRRTTHSGHYNCDGYLYEGEEEFPNIRVILHNGIIRLVPGAAGGSNQSRMKLSDAVKFDFHGLEEPAIRYNDPLELESYESYVVQSLGFHSMDEMFLNPDDGTTEKNTVQNCQLIYI